ncbi:MAG: hypothetical protein HWE08_12620 [Alphaproteobacteria bacterium]|nr:hypothetical protein [Alphaproteobacteria bacterium]
MDTIPEAFQPFIQKWSSLPPRKHPFLPCRSDLTSRLFAEFLPLLCITQVVAPMILPIIYAGEAFERSAGYKLNGVNYYDLLPKKFRKSVAIFHSNILETPCGAFVRDVITTDAGSRYLHETIHLPMVDDEGQVRYVIAYGLGRKPFGDRGIRPKEDQSDTHIKDMHYIDLGAGAPRTYFKNFILNKSETAAPALLSILK